eukprot:TRINITY_DN3929_c5_g1_i1.p1 TRINITY_DN3929_c5_g1~~TRINITY_DN3929_c5_g1_i1.p1  ORF type:complete len:380 (+),score=76.56 TRINITY_DN3929_c5_g1_i1:72-1142(+)
MPAAADRQRQEPRQSRSSRRRGCARGSPAARRCRASHRLAASRRWQRRRCLAAGTLAAAAAALAAGAHGQATPAPPVTAGQGVSTTAGSSTVGGITGTLTSGAFGGLQLGQGFLSPDDCALLIAANLQKEVKDTLPCECRTFSRYAVSCHPNCCPRKYYYEGSDRCHTENEATWTVWEQAVCRPGTTQQNYPGDGVCLYNGGNPFDVLAQADTRGPDAVTRLTFTLSKKPEHRCADLFVSSCATAPRGLPREFRSYSNRDSDDPVGEVCWSDCPPTPLEPCGIHHCYYNRGKTHPFVRSWVVPQLRSGTTYMLTCMITTSGTSAGSGGVDTDATAGEEEAGNINQTQFLPSVFVVP